MLQRLRKLCAVQEGLPSNRVSAMWTAQAGEESREEPRRVTNESEIACSTGPPAKNLRPALAPRPPSTAYAPTAAIALGPSKIHSPLFRPPFHPRRLA